ncbi:hypothetical protein ACWFRF_18245 [Nocardia sp. NPDC055165]|uniref:hypothetical protein n=1 Tax=Nocardia sp. NPDC060220 TaxID=3347076 RepID=UPI003655675F
MAIVEPGSTWAPLEQRSATTTNERHRTVLGMAGGSNVLESELNRLVVDDHCVVNKGFLKLIYPGSE